MNTITLSKKSPLKITVRSVLSILTVISAFHTTHARNDNNDITTGLFAAGVACLAGAGIYAGVKTMNSSNLRSARETLRTNEQAARALEHSYAHQAMLRDEQLVAHYKLSETEFQQHLAMLRHDEETLRSIHQQTNSDIQYWNGTREASDFIGHAHDLVRTTEQCLATVSQTLRHYEHRKPLVTLSNALHGENTLRVHRVAATLIQNPQALHTAIRTEYARETFPYRVIVTELHNRTQIYQAMIHTAQTMQAQSTCSQNVVREAQNISALYTSVQQRIAQTNEYYKEGLDEQQLHLQKASLGELKRQAAAAQEQARAEERRARAAEDQACATHHLARAKDRENDLHVADLALRGTELITHNGCRSKEQSLQNRISQLETDIRNSERARYSISQEKDVLRNELRSLQRELIALERELECSPEFLGYHSQQLLRWQSELVYKIKQLEQRLQRYA